MCASVHILNIRFCLISKSRRKPHIQLLRQYRIILSADTASEVRQLSLIHIFENAFAKKQSRDDLDLVFSVCEARRNPWFNMVKTVDDLSLIHISWRAITP